MIGVCQLANLDPNDNNIREKMQCGSLTYDGNNIYVGSAEGHKK